MMSVCPAGTRTETSSRVTGKEGFEADGIQGLKALGVRELSYRLAFLANHVAPTNPRVRSRVRVLQKRRSSPPLSVYDTIYAFVT